MKIKEIKKATDKSNKEDIKLAFTVLAPIILGCTLASGVVGFRLLLELKDLPLSIGYFVLGIIFNIGFYQILKVYLNSFKEEN